MLGDLLPESQSGNESQTGADLPPPGLQSLRCRRLESGRQQTGQGQERATPQTAACQLRFYLATSESWMQWLISV